MESNAAVQIRNLIIVIGSGVLAALMAAYFLVTHFGPSGEYTLNNILIEPSLVEKVNYEENTSRYAFDRFEFVYYEGQWKRIKVKPEDYSKIYALLQGDKSVTADPTQFYASNPASFTIVVHAENRDNTKVFQEIQFADPGDTYRIVLRDDSKGEDWIYFKHPKALEKIKQVIIP